MEKYTKVVYQSNPIGKEQIILYLTTFDLEAFEKDKSLQKIPTKRVAKVIDIPEKIKYETGAMNRDFNAYQVEMFETIVEKFVKDTYDEQLNQMTKYIEVLRNTKIVPLWYGEGE